MNGAAVLLELWRLLPSSLAPVPPEQRPWGQQETTRPPDVPSNALRGTSHVFEAIFYGKPLQQAKKLYGVVLSKC